MFCQTLLLVAMEGEKGTFLYAVCVFCSSSESSECVVSV